MLSLERQNAYRDRLRSRWPNWRPATELYEATIRQYLRPGVRLLDVGCGRGGVVEQLDGAGHWPAGVDPDLRSLREHRLGLPRATALLDLLPFPAGSFDLLIASWVLEHLPRPAAALAEAARVLRPDGHLILLTPNANHPLALVNRLLARMAPWQASLIAHLYGRAEVDAFPVFYRANTPACLRGLAVAAGLRPLALHTIPDPTYLAFNDPLFELSCALECVLPAGCAVHIVADLVKVCENGARGEGRETLKVTVA